MPERCRHGCGWECGSAVCQVVDRLEQAAQDQRQLYNSNLVRAGLQFTFGKMAIKEGASPDSLDRAREALDLCPAEHRGWEWQYLRRLCRREPIRLTGHT